MFNFNPNGCADSGKIKTRVLFCFIFVQLPLVGLRRELDFIKLLRVTVIHPIAANSISHGPEEGSRANCRYIVEVPHV
jgi:hypothetical protein